LTERVTHYTQAESYYNQSLNIKHLKADGASDHNMKIESLFGLGVLRVCIGRIDEGQQMLLDANKCRPYCESYMIALAICFSAKGKFTKSITLLEQCIQLKNASPLSHIVTAFTKLAWLRNKQQNGVMQSKNLLVNCSLNTDNPNLILEELNEDFLIEENKLDPLHELFYTAIRILFTRNITEKL
jgi:tetratricopeptide (TPR) repeat protein